MRHGGRCLTVPLLVLLMLGGAALAADKGTPSPFTVLRCPFDVPTQTAALPAGDTPAVDTLINDGFEGAFPGATWTVGGAGGPYWGVTSQRKLSGGNSLYCAQSGPGATPAPGPYPNGLDSWLEAGPFDFSALAEVHLSFNAWVDTESAHDKLHWGASHDGSTFQCQSTSGHDSAWLSCPGDLTELSLSPYLGDSSVWICFMAKSDASVRAEGVYLDDILLQATPGTSSVAFVEWLGTPGFETDGVHPNAGDRNTTLFNFKVKYGDTTGSAPSQARCRIFRWDCGATRRPVATIELTHTGGSYATGATYSSGQLTLNSRWPLEYEFRFRDSMGRVVPGVPRQAQTGPGLKSSPMLCWTGNPGYETDGVKPDTEAAGWRFRWAVRHLDAEWDLPSRAQLYLRHPGSTKVYKHDLALGAGDEHPGRIWSVQQKLYAPGTYQYKFVFVDDEGFALGSPTRWRDGPVVSGTTSAGATIAGLAAAPTSAGAQVAFTLSGSASVTATVMNVAGRPIRTLVADRPLEAGIQTLAWNRLADSGLPVPGGLYLIRVTARADDGSQSQALASVRLH